MNSDIRFALEGITFIWNSAKASSNLAKHGITFQQAAQVFFDPMFRIVNADRKDEARDAIMGFDFAGKSLFVVHIELENFNVRLISARLMTAAERKQHDDA